MDVVGRGKSDWLEHKDYGFDLYMSDAAEVASRNRWAASTKRRRVLARRVTDLRPAVTALASKDPAATNLTCETKNAKHVRRRDAA